MKAGSNILVHLVESKSVGYQFEKKREQWPFHITLVRWFFAEESQKDVLLEGVREICDAADPITVRVGNVELFGTQHDTPVNVISDVSALRGLHAALMHEVDESGAEWQVPRTYTGSAYRPHITRHASTGIEQGAVVTVDSVAMISVDGRNMCTVEQIFEIGPRGEKTT